MITNLIKPHMVKLVLNHFGNKCPEFCNGLRDTVTFFLLILGSELICQVKYEIKCMSNKCHSRIISIFLVLCSFNNLSWIAVNIYICCVFSVILN